MSVEPAGASLGEVRAVWLVARREMVTRARNKAFIIGTLGVVVAIGLIALAPMVFSALTQNQTSQMSAEPELAPVLEQVEQQAAETPEVQVETSDWPGRDRAEEAVQDGELDVALIGTDQDLAAVVEGTPDPAILGLIDDVYIQQQVTDTLADTGADEQAVQQALESGVRVQSVDGATGMDQAFLVGTVVGMTVTLLLYISVLIFGVYVAQGVVEEKANRVVELLLATVRPWQLLFGKILGIGALGLIQVGVALVAGVGVALATDYLANLPVSFATLAITLVVWFVLGYVFFAALLAASASLVSRQEEVQSAIQPVMFLIMVPLILAMVTINTGGGTIVSVLATLPPFSPFMMPMMLATGQVALWQNLMALAFLAAALIGVVWLAARIYTGAALRTGSKIPMREALRIARR
ncbi:ABC transporter permease [Lipingzhangella sp. LS1_29]|uniref:ABC transporter permease n=1 Tax=Lipingzhangella rawalii TaxID=2055835 RepID=A0ABU2H2B0_9ACTN|nr:ABC transporter permease [Lipingzhangella rawalii]MDS1269440.1 ABC transporter permease [Lipingzhangella rawalii]